MLRDGEISTEAIRQGYSLLANRDLCLNGDRQVFDQRFEVQYVNEEFTTRTLDSGVVGDIWRVR